MGAQGLDRFFELYLLFIYVKSHLFLYFCCNLFRSDGAERLTALAGLDGHQDFACFDLPAQFLRRLILFLGQFIVVGFLKLQVVEILTVGF